MANETYCYAFPDGADMKTIGETNCAIPPASPDRARAWASSESTSSSSSSVPSATGNSTSFPPGCEAKKPWTAT